jgi:cellulose synthase (UDP-forming)
VTDYSDYLPLVIILLIFFALRYVDSNSKLVRELVSWFAIILGLNYFIWRYAYTLDAHHPTGAFEHFWVNFVFFIELLTFIDTSIFFITMSRKLNRSSQADELEKSRHLVAFPLVDVFIPTYNEPLQVLEKTIVGAKNIDYPNKKVWVLDDSQRDYVRDFCAKRGVEYISRTDNLHAKAGNINNALQFATGEYLCIFDADFVPHRNFIRRLLGFFNDPSIGIVQTPQHFYNKDIIQTNLGIQSQFPDEQRLFFDEIQSSRDAWGVAFCCGSCSMTRRSALDEIGGLPTLSVTEDLLTTLVLLRKGFKTIYLNEKLSIGLSAETINGFFIQRARWCRGAIQILFSKEGQLGPGLTFVQHVLFFPAYWLFNSTGRLLLLLVPIVYLLSGVEPYYFGSFDQLLIHQFPVYLTYFFAMRWLVKTKWTPLVSTSVNVLLCFRMFPVVIWSLINPFNRIFRITPKGIKNTSGVDYASYLAIMTTFLLSLYGLYINSNAETAVIEFDSFFPVAVFWTSINCLILLIASWACFEGPRYRSEERFSLNEPVKISNGLFYRDAIVSDASLNGCKLIFEDDSSVMQQHEISIIFPDIGPVLSRIVNMADETVTAEFQYRDESARDRMIAKLFSGKYDNSIHEVADHRSLIRSLMRRALT